MIGRGDMNPRPTIRVEKETAATVLIDGDRALGPVVTTVAMRRAIEKARGGGHRLGGHPQHDAPGRDGLLRAHGRRGRHGGARHRVQPSQHGALRRARGGRPQQPDLDRGPRWPAPPALRRHGDERGGRGKLSLARDKGVPLPPGWALDAAGQPTTDATRAKILVPVGGPKGSGLAIMFETLTSLMVGNPLLGPALFGEAGAGRHRQNSVVAAIDIGAFTDLAAVSRRGRSADRGLRALPPTDGVSRSPRSRRAGGPHRRGAAPPGIPLPPGRSRTSAASPRASESRCLPVSERDGGAAGRRPAWRSSGRGVHSGPWNPTRRSRQPSSSAGSTPASATAILDVREPWEHALVRHRRGAAHPDGRAASARVGELDPDAGDRRALSPRTALRRRRPVASPPGHPRREPAGRDRRLGRRGGPVRGPLLAPRG